MSERSAVFENCSCYVPFACAALLICSQPFQPFRECSLTVLLGEHRFRSTGTLFLLCSPLASAALLICSQPFQPFRECSLIVLLYERAFRSIRELFLLGSSCFRCGPELFTAIPAVPRVFSDCSSRRASIPQYSRKVLLASAVVL